MLLQNFADLELAEQLELVIDHCGIQALNAKTGEELDMWWWAEVTACVLAADASYVDLEVCLDCVRVCRKSAPNLIALP